MIYVVDLEPLEERYTKQWSTWIPRGLQAIRTPFKVVSGTTLTSKIETGSVLDAYGTNYYKASQLQTLMDMLRKNEINDGDTLFFCDLWFPGIESLQYVRNITGKKFKIQGILHAGSWDTFDFTFLTGMSSWARHVELGWLSFIDKVFLGSAFHKSLIVDAFPDIDQKKLIVTGIPFVWTDVFRPSDSIRPQKERIVVFPHRLDKEKRPDLFDDLQNNLSSSYPLWDFVKTKDRTSNKEEYYNLLNRAAIAVSYAEQETFGYAMLEAVANDCFPVVPNKLSYKTMRPYDSSFRFSSFEQSIEMVSLAINMFEETRDIYTGMVRGSKQHLTEFLPENVFRKMLDNGLA